MEFVKKKYPIITKHVNHTLVGLLLVAKGLILFQISDISEDVYTLHSEMTHTTHFGQAEAGPEAGGLVKQDIEQLAMEYLYANNIAKALQVVTGAL